MKAGKYSRNGQIGVFLVRSDGGLVDAQHLASNASPEQIREVARLASRGDSGFCAALPLIESYLSEKPDSLDHASTLPSDLKFEPPTRPQSFLCVGLNYKDHAAESKMELPKAPLLFAKTGNAISAHYRDVAIPPNCTHFDFEAELAVVMGKRCRNVSREDAAGYIAGYTCGNDLSARDFQFGDGQWYRGKSCDGFGPLGPWLVTPAEIGDPQSLGIRLRINGTTMQDSNTCNLVFDVPALVEYASNYMTLDPGDVILTGTPPGVGFSRKPPIFLKSGDVVEVEIERIGVLVNRIR
ncbi:MAG: fumarylacetoacetate hydrolase family protein [Acidobacteriaceae bacterium]